MSETEDSLEFINSQDIEEIEADIEKQVLKDNSHNEYIEEAQPRTDNIYLGHFHLPHTDENERKMEELFLSFDKYCITKEVSNECGEHYHFFIEWYGDKPPITDNALKANIRKQFPHLKREGKGGGHKYALGQ